MNPDPLKDIKSSRGKELKGRRVILCITGSVAAMDAPSLARELIRHGAEVNVVMSGAAQRLLKPDMMEWATGNPVVKSLTGKTEHVRLAGSWPGKADAVLVAPCTANTISKIALGIDDTPVTTFASMALGSGIPIVLCPAAHEPMYRNDAVAENLTRLRARGVEVVEPRMEEKKAKVADNETIVASVMRVLARRDLKGMRVLVTGGPTVEFIDPIRVITNLSSGKMGVSLVKEAWRRGARVAYVYGGNLSPPAYIQSRRIVTTDEMLEQVIQETEKGCDIFIASAAPADFAPERSFREKIPTRRGSLSLRLKPTTKIIETLRKRRRDIFIVAFKAETVDSSNELRRRATKFMKESGMDMVVANDASRGAPFGSDYNEVVVVSKGRGINVAWDTKESVAGKIIDEVVRAYRRR